MSKENYRNDREKLSPVSKWDCPSEGVSICKTPESKSCYHRHQSCEMAAAERSQLRRRVG
jgi:hypothetical protein